MAYCTLLAAQYSLRHTFTLFLRTVPRTTSVELTVCALERSSGEDTFLISEPKIGNDVLDALARLSCVPIATDVSAAELPDDPRDLALPEDAASTKHPFGQALVPWFEDVTVRLYGDSYLRKDALGGGATGKAAVYQRLGGRSSEFVVIKKVNDEAQLAEVQALANEHQILTTFQEHLGDVQDKRLLERVVTQVKPPPPGWTWDGRHLVMTPVCDRLELDALNYTDMVADLVTALRLAATANYVHRDVRPANIMVSQEPCVCNKRQPHYHAVLIDWAFAIKTGAGPVPYQGTVSCASQNVLDALSQGQSHVSLSFADDAESLVKALLRVSRLVRRMGSVPNVQVNAHQWLKYWESMSADSISLANAIKAAQACVQPTAQNFQALQDAITMMLKLHLE